MQSTTSASSLLLNPKAHRLLLLLRVQKMKLHLLLLKLQPLWQRPKSKRLQLQPLSL
jgi:hypothetical protein